MAAKVLTSSHPSIVEWLLMNREDGRGYITATEKRVIAYVIIGRGSVSLSHLHMSRRTCMLHAPACPRFCGTDKVVVLLLHLLFITHNKVGRRFRHLFSTTVHYITSCIRTYVQVVSFVPGALVQAQRFPPR